MKSSRLLLILSSLLFLALSIASCKDDDDDTSYYFGGELVIKVDSYAEPGYSKSFCIDTLMTVWRYDDSDAIGYYVILPNSSVRDTLRTEDGTILKKNFTVVAPDSLGTFTCQLVAFSDGYYESTGLGTITVVKPGLNGEKTTLTNYDITPETPSFIDGRDGRKYLYSEVNGLQWMRQNLSWEGSGISYEKCSSPGVSTVIGRFYTWNEAQNVCPDGWRLPSEQDWVDLCSQYVTGAARGKDINGVAGKFMEDIYFNGVKMWEYWPEVKIKNDAGLSLAPFGYAMVDEDSYLFKGAYEYAAFWTSDEDEGLGVYRYVYDEKDILYYGAADKQYFVTSVRCVRDIPTL